MSAMGRLLLAAPLSATCLTLVGFPAVAAQAENAERVFDISTQPLSAALLEFSRQSDVSVAVSPELVANKTANAVKGRLKPAVALDRLLAGSGLSPIRQSDGVITLSPIKVRQPRGFTRPTTRQSTASNPSSSGRMAQSSATQTQNAQAPTVEEIVVTGTRVVRDGYEAPTPLTVVSMEQIQQMAPANIADYLNTLPQLVGNASPQTSRQSISGGGAGLNTLNLRSLGGTRTLVLLDGQRSVGSQPTGLVDINTFPQQLISRVDVVTGGASAQYGSDAVAGVVNFILDKNFVGVKGEIQGGITTYGDDRNWNIKLSAGTGFANNRGHFLVSGEAAHIDGIMGVPRAWAKQGWHIILNPAYAVGNGQPFQLVLPQTSQSNQTPGGIITAGPLKGIAFGPGGTPYEFNYGTLISDPWMQGGDWVANDITASMPGGYYGAGDQLDPSETRQNTYARLSYEITDDIEVFGTWNWAYDNNFTICCSNFDPGDLTVKADNAFIPASLQTQMTALKLTSLPFGTMSADLPPISARNTRKLARYVVGGNGKFDAFGSSWTWDGYYQAGNVGADKRFMDRLKTHLTQALDAVRAPNGAIVCRSTLTNPSNGCVPFDLFGVGVNSAAAVHYASQYSYAYETYREEVMAANLRAEPFSVSAGPVSFATGIEHRVEAGGGIQSADNAANNSYVGNQAPIFGSYNVTEGYLETVVPLANDASWAKQVDLNAAARFTNYSTAGFVTTWKVGATYTPIADIRFRVTRSRDIRAPNRTELFAAGIYTGNLVNDPFHNNTPVNVQSLQVGNPKLVPEKGDTTGLGVVVQPRFFRGFNASVDYYSIDISDAINTVSRQDVPNRCYAGETAFCSALTFDPITGYLSGVVVQPTNFVVQRERGIDLEASYTLKMESLVSSWNGDLSFRGLATRYITDYTDDGAMLGVTRAVGNNGSNGPPHWKYQLIASYTDDPIVLSLTARGISPGVTSNQNIQCTSGCPAINVNTVTINNNYMPGAHYWDLGFTYSFNVGDADLKSFFTVRNLFNTSPPIAAQGPQGAAFATPPCNAALYDCLGRQFRAGIRFEK
jgi:outer membrane receptor protein involved in Fe transport